VFSDLGGLFNALTIIGNILVVHFNKKRFDYELINKTFYLENQFLNSNIILNNKFNKGKSEGIILENKAIKIETFKNNKESIPKLELEVLENNSVNKSNCKLNKPSFKITENNPMINYEKIDKSLSNIINENEKLKDERIINTKTFNNTTFRLNVELGEWKIKDKKIPKEENKDNKISNEGEITKNDNNLIKNIEIFLENKKTRKNRKKFVKFSKFEFFLRFFPCKSFKNKSLIEREILISRAEDKINEYLDVCSYTSLIENVHKLKLIILNNYQKLLFEHQKNRNPTELFYENYNNRILETILFYKQKIKDSDLNQYDEKLLENLSKEFVDLILV